MTFCPDSCARARTLTNVVPERKSMQWYVRGPLDLEKAMAKEKSDGDKFSAIGKQTITRSYSALDYYFDHLKKCIASAPSGGTEP